MSPVLREKGRNSGLSGAVPPAGAAPGSGGAGFSQRIEGAQAGLAALRAQVRRIEQGPHSAWGIGAGRARPVAPLGLAALDDALPGGGLPLGALHEIEGERAEWDDGVTTGFCLALLARLERAFPNSGQIPPRTILWISRQGDLYPPALAGQGLDPGRVLLVRARADHEVLWAMEEGLRCRRLAAVVGEVEALDRLAGRRLQLAAEASLGEQGGVTAFALHRRFGPPRRGRAASAALSRWRVTSAASQDALGDSFIGRPQWRLDLLRCRGAAPGSWQVEWDDAACGFSLAPALRDGSLGKESLGEGAPAEPRRDAELIDFRQVG